MSAWISDLPARCVQAAALLALSACAHLPDLPALPRIGLPDLALGDFGLIGGGSGPPPRRMAVAHGQVVIDGPRGFCIDREVSADQAGTSALVVLSGCRALGGGLFSPRPAHPALLTAAVAPLDRDIDLVAAAPMLERFFASPAGRAALSRQGDAATVTIGEQRLEGDAWLIHLSDMAPFTWGEVQLAYWRALLMLGGRMVTLSVLALPDRPLAPDQGLDLLRSFITSARMATLDHSSAD